MYISDSNPSGAAASYSAALRAPGQPSAAMVSTDARIGLSLSGGGIRAAIFHLGVLKWLAELSMLENLRHISTVSGASLAAALVYAKSGGRFPSSAQYLSETLPAIRETILKNDIQDRAIMSLTLRPWNWHKKTNLMAEAIEQLWGIRGKVRDLPPDPLWSINCTTFETGKDFRISQLEMGDYKVGYIDSPPISIAEAAAASAGFPVLIGPYRLCTRKYHWADQAARGAIAPSRILHLWDGGVYDNLGLEALYKIADSGHLTGDLTYLIISNASSSSGYARRAFFSPVRNFRRLLSITMDQVNALRTRDVTDYLYRTGNGCYLRIGSSEKVLDTEQQKYVKNYPTTLSSPSPQDYDLILLHGYEVAKQQLYTPKR